MAKHRRHKRHTARAKKNPNLFLLIIIGIILLGLVSALIVLQKTSLSLRSSASPTCDPNCVTEPACCGEILNQLREKGDITDLPDSEQPYHACEWPIRGYCRPETCNQLPSGLQYRGRCGWYWSFHNEDPNINTPNGYGCMIGNTPETMRPICGGGGPPPTSGPRPTNPPPPTNPPTRPPRVPTATPAQPIYQPTVRPTSPQLPLVPSATYAPGQPTQPPTNPTTGEPPPNPTSEAPPVTIPTDTQFIPPFVPPPGEVSSPTPTPVPAFWEVAQNVERFFNQTRSTLIKFFTTILP